VAPLDPDGTLQHEWLNARGAIARFDRNTIEIRVLDVQECPQADLAICRMITDVLQALCQERWLSLHRQQAFATQPLHAILLDTIREAERAIVGDPAYAAAFGYDLAAGDRCTAGQLWRHLHGQLHPTGSLSPQHAAALETLLGCGSLSTRILRSLDDHQAEAIRRPYRELCSCLDAGRMYDGDG
jgi:hypothetical protein